MSILMILPGRLLSALIREIGAVWEYIGSYFVAGRDHDVTRPVAEPRRLTLAEQWELLSNVIRGAASRAEEATRCHASASLQLDLAQYALTSLVDELSLVMDMGGRRRRATVHVLEVLPARPIGDAIAA
jgi:hypothetical protein